jgi:hypothetical protein
VEGTGIVLCSPSLLCIQEKKGTKGKLWRILVDFPIRRTYACERRKSKEIHARGYLGNLNYGIIIIYSLGPEYNQLYWHTYGYSVQQPKSLFKQGMIHMRKSSKCYWKDYGTWGPGGWSAKFARSWNGCRMWLAIVILLQSTEYKVVGKMWNLIGPFLVGAEWTSMIGCFVKKSPSTPFFESKVQWPGESI